MSWLSLSALCCSHLRRGLSLTLELVSQLASPSNPLVPVHRSPEVISTWPDPAFHVAAVDLNSGPHAHAASTLFG